MAKMIKCPTCATQIEVPNVPGGQIIKCPGCGKGLKLVAKKPHAPQQSPGGSVAGGSIAGGSVSAMTFTGDAPPDDMPSLDSNCAVCGRPTDPEKLTEDNGRLVCPDCIKGARSKIDRPDGDAELIDFKRPLPAAKRGKLIRMTPAMVGFIAACLLFFGAHIYLSLIEQPKGRGRAMGSPVGPGAVAPATKPSDIVIPPETGATEPTTEPAPHPTTQSSETPVAAITTQPTDVAPATTQGTAVAAVDPAATTPVPGSTLFPDNGVGTAPPVQPEPVTPPAHPPVAVNPPGPGNPRPIAPAADPLAEGIEKLQAKDYPGAYLLFEAARNNARVFGRVGEKLTPSQQTVLEGLAAASIGKNDTDAAMTRLNIILGQATTPAKGIKSRSAVLNYAIVAMSKKTKDPREYANAINLISQLLPTCQNDEFVANIFGTLLDRASTIQRIPKDALQPHILRLDQYVDSQLQGTEEARKGNTKWGIEWKPREMVMMYRAARGRTTATPAPEQLQRDLENAKAKVLTNQQAVATAKANQGDVVGAQNQLRDALAALADVQMKIEAVAAPAPKPKWLEKFDPVVPETTLALQ